MLPVDLLHIILVTLNLTSSSYKPSPPPNEIPLNVNNPASLFTFDVQDAPPALAVAMATVEQDSVQNPTVPRPSAVSKTGLSSPSAPAVLIATAPSNLEGFNATPGNPCTVEPYVSPVVLEPFAPFDQTKATVYRYRQQQGINLGSVFVNENWMVPSLFLSDCAHGARISEIDIASGWGSTKNARALLERHWDTFITEADIAHLAEIGINTLRVPIGYWNLGPKFCVGTPYEPVADVYQNSWAHIVHIINIAAKHQVGVLIDLHGAFGSQNGQPHSGVSDGQTNLFTNKDDQDKTIEVLKYLARQLASVTNVVGIEILNEPQDDAGLETFYTRAINEMRGVSPHAAAMPLYLHDAFDPQRFHEFVKARSDFCVEDIHLYYVFTPQDLEETPEAHADDITGFLRQSLTNASGLQRNNLVVGEFSCALDPMSVAKEADPEAARKNFCEAQVRVYQAATSGWYFWSYFKEGCDTDEDWCFKNIVGNTLPNTFFSYPRGSDRPGLPSSHVISQILHIPLPEDSMIMDATQATPDALLAKRAHRFASIRSRQPGTAPVFFGPEELSTTDQSTLKGFKDGFETAKFFAAMGMSKLGFKGQYMEDSLRSLQGQIEAGTEQNYRDGFGRGLVEAEKIVSRIAESIK